jgi:hypothetical protein
MRNKWPGGIIRVGGAMSTDRMIQNRWNIEHALYAIAFFLALCVRLFKLGDIPLSDDEAGWALQALSIARGEPVAMGPQPLYVVVTSVLFFLFSPTNFLARLLPAVVGATLVLLPLFHRLWLGRIAALILAFGLALDPGLLAVSRMAGGPLLGVAFGLAALTAVYTRRWAGAGFLSALALLSGTSIIHGALALGLTWGVSAWLEAKGRLSSTDESVSLEDPPNTIAKPVRTSLYWLGGTLLVLGTLFLRVPQGLGALAGTVPAYIEGWVAASGVPGLRLPAALLVYQPLVVLFALIAVVRTWSPGAPWSGYLKRLSLWAAFAFLLAFLYPGRQVVDLIWVLVPLWALASFELAHQFTRPAVQNTLVVSAGQAVLILLLLAFAWLMLANLGNVRILVTPEVMQNALILIFGAFLMAGLLSALVALGWSWDISRRGLLWGITGGLVLWMLTGAAGSTQLRRGAEQELWVKSPMIAQADLLLTTLSDLSAWETGHRNRIDVAVYVEAPSLHWVLRDFPGVSFGNAFSLDAGPSTIIAHLGQETPALASTYRGQDFAWQAFPVWEGILPGNLPQWLAFKEAPEQYTQIILWAREDIFPNGSESSPDLSPLLEDLLIDPGME